MIPAHENPLRMELVTDIPFRFPAGDWESNLARLAKQNYRAAVVGRRGSGKSTLLRQLQRRLSKNGMDCDYVFLPHETDAHAELITKALERGSLILLDGIERLNLKIKWKLMKATQVSGVIVSLHHPISLHPIPLFRVPTWIRVTTSFDLLEQLLSDLGLNQPAVLNAGKTAFNHHRGNIRETLWELYDQFADGRLEK